MRDFGYDWDRRARTWRRCSRTGEPLSREANAKIDQERADRARRILEQMAKRRHAVLSR